MEFNETLNNLKNYEAGKPIEELVKDFDFNPKDIIKLASNENPYGCSKKVKQTALENLDKIPLYPDDSMYELKNALAKRFELKDENIIIGAGSDQVISFCIGAKCKQNSKVLMAKTTFAMYEISAKQVGAKILKTPSSEHRISEFEEIYKANPDIAVIFLCLPNNPLGECLSTKDVYLFLEKVSKNTLVIIDGAYQEFASFKDINKKIIPKDLLEKFENVVYLGTFSKAYGMGGLRVGYGLSSKEIINTLHKLRPPFNITSLSLACACTALEDEAFIQQTLVKNFEEMEKYEEFLSKNRINFTPSYANFMTINFSSKYKASEIAKEFLKKGIILRDLRSYGLNSLRITIGDKEQNIKVRENLAKFLTH